MTDEMQQEPPRPTQPLTPAQHVARGKELIREIERARERGGYNSVEISAQQADAALAGAHFSAAITTEGMLIAEQERNPVRQVDVDDTQVGPMPKHAHERAAQLAENHLPNYLGAFLAGVLRQHHSLPPLIEHQDRIATDLIEMLSAIENGLQRGSVDDVADKLGSFSVAYGGETPVYVEREGEWFPVTGVRYEEHPEDTVPRLVVISG